MGLKKALGALVTCANDSATPRGPSLKNNGPSVQDTTCSSFLPPPHATSLCLPLVHSLSLTGREQGMLIKGCENQEKKRDFIGIQRER